MGNHMHNVFISYHHQYDQAHKNELIQLGKGFSFFIDKSVDTGDYPHLPDRIIDNSRRLSPPTITYSHQRRIYRLFRGRGLRLTALSF